MTNLYVGNLDYGVSSDDLRELFEEFGVVTSAKVITDRETDRSKGFGFVEMENEEEAQEAIDELDGAEYEGRTLKVNIARPRENRDKRKEFNR
ncbi:RNA-binding protein [Aliifodinibius sp. S!AR15-10]|uniref:RNA recognition motif domain-containing protein n=1 Tax=Aliifodinibius sp. S!AR15-10 TaxID=2950437 RepID=UPI002859FB35|nr:RNA-binding protein [Aliifodinibius sp. S!AR15-10]MDR8391041.1 RNA-binding protein [Aliifodinibius sp. S!AR15-10]